MLKLRLIPLASASLLLFSCGGNGGGKPEPTKIRIDKLISDEQDMYGLVSEKFNVSEGEEFIFTIPISALTEEHIPTSPVDSITFRDSEDKGFFLAEKPSSFKYNGDDIIFHDVSEEGAAMTWVMSALMGTDPTLKNTYIVTDRVGEYTPMVLFEHTGHNLEDEISISFTSAVEKENVIASFANLTAS